LTAGQPTQTSRRLRPAAQTIASAATSGWKIGGSGCGALSMWLCAQSNWGVLNADSWTMVRRTAPPSCRGSQRSESEKPRIARLQRHRAVGERRADLDHDAATASSALAATALTVLVRLMG
jgi:hypothetical protein